MDVGKIVGLRKQKGIKKSLSVLLYVRLSILSVLLY
ncbi:hypothetical protein SAMN05444350_1088 [Bacteroides stercorirosoris]|uniref:Uncharacterized protein n=1 Tax=Bacteroides stercorirosoris TaxID=871324 RepID=A0A1M6DZF4_9BACE|nr:hypothetical protein SAMN05444350_1088 [Bacteroides stercorirosoris]